MSQTTMTLAIASGIASLFLSTVCLVVSCLALGMIYGLKNSTHKIIQGPWDKVSTDEPNYINSDNPTYTPDSAGDLDDIQDLPVGMRSPKPETIMDQMKSHMYPDVSEEQV